MFLGRCDKQLPGVLGVADRRLGVKAEHRRQVQRVRPAGEGFLELPVDAEPFQGGGLSAQGCAGEVDGADRSGSVRAHLVDQQVGVGGAWPAGVPVAEPFEQDLAGELVDGAGSAADGQPPVAEVDVVEEELADVLGAGGVHRGQDQDQPAPRVAAALAAWSISSWRSGWMMP